MRQLGGGGGGEGGGGGGGGSVRVALGEGVQTGRLFKEDEWDSNLLYPLLAFMRSAWRNWTWG